MPDDPLACPDFLAERRHAYGRAAADEGDWRAAAEMFEQALERAPDWPPALFALGEAREKLGDAEGAAKTFRAALAADPSDALGASARLAFLEGTRLKALPSAYVARLFDGYAARFDTHLMDKLAYRGPALIMAALDEVLAYRGLGSPRRDQPPFAFALDIGCGTGLMGEAIRARVQRLSGVDLSPRMIAEAKRRAVYDDLAVGGALPFLEGSAPARFDLVLAADAFCYIGDLRPVLAACRRALMDDGLLAFTVETFEGDGFRLTQTLRFAHARAYAERAGREAGLRPLLMKKASTRREAGAGAPGLVCVMAA